MQNEFFQGLESILYEYDFDEKFKKFTQFYEDFKAGKLVFNHEQRAILKHSLPQNLAVTEPIKAKRVRKVCSNETLAKMLHSIAHIEFCAINLALDSTYRFRGLEMHYYRDWLEVVADEIKHFRLLQGVLNELGFKYPCFAVHLSLENALKATANSLKNRMGVVHRGLEAKGLDANPFVLAKLNDTNHALKALLGEILGIILQDEITHVAKGDRWYKFALNAQNSAISSIFKKPVLDDFSNFAISSHENLSQSLIEKDFIALCAEFSDFVLAGKILNKKARLRAGFSESELEKIADFYAKKAKK